LNAYTQVSLLPKKELPAAIEYEAGRAHSQYENRVEGGKKVLLLPLTEARFLTCLALFYSLYQHISSSSNNNNNNEEEDEDNKNM
jgi:hypothetical protein